VPQRKPMNFKDYYSILGLQKTASLVEIKQTFYKLALKYHPDKNPLNPASSDIFKEITEANKVLSDPEKRKKYDKLFIEFENAQSTKKHGYESYFDQKRKFYQSQSTCPHTKMKEDLSKKSSNFSYFINNFINPKFSSKVSNNSHNINNSNPYRKYLHIPLEDTLHGAIKCIVVNNAKVQVRITPGITNGKEIIYYGFFSDTCPLLKQNLIITVLVDKHPIFKRFNQNLMCSLNIDFYTAILGGPREIITLDNKLLRLKIPKCTENGTLLRLKGQGLPFPSNIDSRGDLFVKVTVHLPKNLSKYELNLFEKLSFLRKMIHPKIQV
jgi:curved DNA-binding protein